MKFQVGDPVIVLKTKEEGKVMEILGKDMLSIQVGGTTFPIFETEVDHPYLYWFLDKTKQAKNTTTKHAIETSPIQVKARAEVSNNASKYPRGLKIIFIPYYKTKDFDSSIEKVRVYLSNNLNQAFSFSYYFESRDGEKFEIKSELMPFQDFYVHDVSYEHLATNPYFNIIGSEIVDDIISTISNFDHHLKIKPKQLFSILQEMEEKERPYFSFDIIEVETIITEVPIKPYLAKVTPEQQPAQKPKGKTKEEIQEEIEEELAALPFEPDWDSLFISKHEVDLHIEKIHDNHQLLKPQEKLEFQLLAAEKVLFIAFERRLGTLILIHGNGKGVLKQRLFSVLDQTNWVHSYVNKEDKRYGLGATEVFLGY
jgi:Smr domain